MGNCTTGVNNSKSKIKQLQFSRCSSHELELLQLMYKDIVQRASKPGIIREHFDAFFHLNGLWGEQMFRTFDIGKQGYITQMQFLTSIDLMVKGTFDQKSKILFDFYDVEKTNTISYNQLIKMLFSYEKSQLNKLVTEERFLNYMEQYQKNIYFCPQLKFLERKSVIDVDQITQQSQDESVKSLDVSTNKRDSGTRDSLIEKLKSRDSAKSRDSGKEIEVRTKSQNKFYTKIQKSTQSSTLNTNLKYLKIKKYVMRSNITSLVRKYADFLFKELGLDTKKNQIEFSQFKQLLKSHQSIFDSYLEGFHTYIWQYDQDLSIPQFLRYSPWIQNQCQYQVNLLIQSRYLYFLKSTIFVFKNKNKTTPIQIINMEGLWIQEIDSDYIYGFFIQHRDKIYPSKKILFETLQIKEQWMFHLQQYKSKSVYDCYTFFEKVGQGQYSSVYKALPKQKNPSNQENNEFVAIKAIKKYKLSELQNNILKFQWSVLKLCHHPNILKIHQIFNTRSNTYIVTQYLGEGDLFSYVDNKSFLGEYEAAIIFKQLIEVVAYFGQIGLIHRDLKPENTMIQLNKQKNIVQKCIIIDFGFAVYKKNLEKMNQKQKFVGTLGFTAPEIVNHEDFDQNVDIFSLGVILYFMLSGQLPFCSSFLQQIAQQTKKCNLILNSKHWDNVSDQAKDLIHRTIALRNQRIKLKQLIEHPWIKSIQRLKRQQKIH